MIESRDRRQVEDALRLIRGGVIDAGATTSSGRLLLQHRPLREEPNLGEAQEDQAENRLRVLGGRQAGVGADWSALSGVPDARYSDAPPTFGRVFQKRKPELGLITLFLCC